MQEEFDLQHDAEPGATAVRSADPSIASALWAAVQEVEHSRVARFDGDTVVRGSKMRDPGTTKSESLESKD